ncbi:hypothetical protein [Chryseolinea sp. H1M3-3]|uniref:hypothetical protein n=1 Tax=Chryseolinea sp. H1M3-3 TaxID=3034144 RepID=UPI0023EE20E7|nr:hypothetical protein [Chryseolinea sp. H1M3-3]
MRISTKEIPPPTNDLIKILKQELPAAYSCELYGLGKNKSIIVSKSNSVGAQISIHENEITIQGAPPPPFAYFMPFMVWTELAILLPFFVGVSTVSKLKELEKEIAVFLKNKYGLAANNR